MDVTTTFQLLAIALGLGLLVGLQREHSASKLAGVRTFPLVTFLGALAAMLGQYFGGWVIAAGFLALAGLVFVGNLATFKDGRIDPGLTTEIAIVLMYAVGAYLVIGHRAVAIAVGAGVAVLLQFKVQLHGFAERLGDDDLKAIMQFALVSLVILPVLPNRAYGPYDVLNPRQIWWMVVLIVGINLAGYIAYKFLGPSASVALGGLLGGLISSTATTVSYSRQTRASSEGSPVAAVVIMIASAVVFPRVLLLMAVVAPPFAASAALPILILFGVAAALAAGAWFTLPRGKIEMPARRNPSELKSALLDGLVFAVVLFAVAAVRERFGGRGLYTVAALSGLTDVDAITLSTGQLVNSGRLPPSDGWRLVVVAVMSNLVFKGAIVAVVADSSLLRRVARLFGIAVAAGLLLLLLLR
jgi:uncharacterized membrane protein (DUF4010 family)